MTTGGPRPAVDRRLVSSAAHVFVDDLEHPALGEDDAHHLGRVLRLRRGQVVTVSDGDGRWREARFDDGSLEPTGDVMTEDRPAVPVGVGFAVLKGDRSELVVQKLTELGVDVIIPFVSERTVVRVDRDRAHRQDERFRRIGREAAMQSRRVRLPQITAIADLSTVAIGPGWARADFDGRPPTLEHPTLLIGPEGGWAPSEREAVPASVCLGPHVLRAETAAIAAGTLLASLRAGTVRATDSADADGDAGW